jgi:small GTP-binding protein
MDLKSKNPEEKTINLMFLGETNVGKTCLIHKIMNNSEDCGEFNPKQTIGVDYQMKMILIQDKFTKFNIWDTAGQERFHSMALNFIKKAELIALCFALDDQGSFDKVTQWLKNINDYSQENVVVVLVGNKIDLVHVVQKKDIQNLVNETHLKYFETSASTGQGIDKMLKDVGELLIENQQNRSECCASLDSSLNKNTIILNQTNKEKPMNKCCV